MSLETTIICPGCGQILQRAADDSRLEIECFWCGRKCPLPAGAGQPSRPPVSSPAPAIPQLPNEDQTGLTLLPLEEEGALPAGKSWPEQEPYQFQDGPVLPATFAMQPAAGEAPAAEPAPPPSSGADEEDDGRPYRLDSKADRPCPQCGQLISSSERECPACRLDLETGSRPRKEFAPVQRTWEAGWPLETRSTLFILVQAVVFPVGLVGSFFWWSFWVFLLPWLFISVLAAYLLGTFNRVEMSRSKRGKVVLKNSWRFFFLAQPSARIFLGEYEGVTSGQTTGSDFFDWLVAVIFLGSSLLWGLFLSVFLTPLGIIAAGMWWFAFIHQEIFYVALTRDHGHPTLMLYRGWSEEQMQEMTRTIKEIAFPGT